MIKRITTVFEQELQQANKCVEEHRYSEFFIHDPHPTKEKSGPCYVVTAGRMAKTDLHIRNPQGQIVHLIAIDKCLYGDGDPTKCDCALLIKEQLYFVEFKTSETDRHASPGDCIDQLAASIRDFYDLRVIEPGETVFAYACVGFTKEIPLNGARQREQTAALFDKIQENKPRKIRLRYRAEVQIDVA